MRQTDRTTRIAKPKLGLRLAARPAAPSAIAFVVARKADTRRGLKPRAVVGAAMDTVSTARRAHRTETVDARVAHLAARATAGASRTAMASAQPSRFGMAPRLSPSLAADAKPPTATARPTVH